jgi:orotate phosphoribosyltransferase
MLRSRAIARRLEASVMQALRAVRARGARVTKIITLVDRLEGAEENLGKEGIELVSLYTTRHLLG